jgi:hypothetical protein
MSYDQQLADLLVRAAANYQEKTPVFRIEPRTDREWEVAATRLADRFCEAHGLAASRQSPRRRGGQTIIDLAEGARAVLYRQSGAIALSRGWPAAQYPISENADDVARDALIEQASAAVRTLELDRSTGLEDLRFERLWMIKATGVTRERSSGAVTLERAVGAFRRHLAGLPVWGRASVFTKIARRGRIDAAGVDWRPVLEDPIDEATVLDPSDAAKGVLDHLAGFRPEGRITADDYVPELFALGYFSLPKRRAQTVMQPVWVAMLRGQDRTSINRLVVVPATAKVYEPFHRIVAAPPGDAMKPEPPPTG